MIAVVGGTGRLGRALVPLLREDGAAVRVVSRHAVLPPELVGIVDDVVAADVRDPATLPAALAGADVVVSAVHGMDPTDRGTSPGRVDHRGNVALVDVAARAGARVVLVSVHGAAPTGTELQVAKWSAEEHLRAAGVPWTAVRAPAFLELWQEVLAGTAARDGRAVVLGTGRNPVGFVHVATVARAVADACRSTAPGGTVVELPADLVLTLTDLAAGACRPGRTPRHVPRGLVRAAGLVLRPVSPGVARMARTAVWMDTPTGAAGDTMSPR